MKILVTNDDGVQSPGLWALVEKLVGLGDVTVSRHHAKLFLDETGLRIEDLGSTNGTYVNGIWADSAALDADDKLIIGKFHLVVARGDI